VESVEINGVSVDSAASQDVRGIERGVANMLQTACDAGNMAGCVGLGAMYWQGNLVPRDRALAKQFLRRACSAGDANGCRVLQALAPAPLSAAATVGSVTNGIRLVDDQPPTKSQYAR
jgi:TPR repeat protein